MSWLRTALCEVRDWKNPVILRRLENTDRLVVSVLATTGPGKLQGGIHKLERQVESLG